MCFYDQSNGWVCPFLCPLFLTYWRIYSFYVLRQSFCGKFQIVCGVWTPVTPAFRMYALKDSFLCQRLSAFAAYHRQHCYLPICGYFAKIWLWLSLTNSESEANPNNNLMMRRACLSSIPGQYCLVHQILSHCLTNLVTLLVFIVKPQVEHYKAVLAQTESMLTSLQVRNLSPFKMKIWAAFVISRANMFW